jgi:hypothetical protein
MKERNFSAWSEEEVKNLLFYQNKFKNKWTTIAKYIPGRDLHQ